MRAKWLLPGFGLLLLVSAGHRTHAALRPQGRQVVRDHVGRWNIQPTKFAPEIPADERTHVAAWMTQIIDVLHHDPDLATPHGFDVTVYASAGTHDLDNQIDTSRPRYIGGELQILLAPYEKSGAGVAANERDATRIAITVNDLSVFNGWEMGMSGVTKTDAGVRFLKDPPAPFEMRHDLPVYHNWMESESWVLMTRAMAPLFAPVTRETYVQSSLAGLQKVAARPLATPAPPPSNDPAVIAAWQEAQRRMAEISQTYQDQTTKLKQTASSMSKQLAAMSPAERNSPVFIANIGPNDSGEIEFAGAAGSDAQAVVARNAALMNDRLPRWTPQILAISIQRSDAWPELSDSIEEKLDWNALHMLILHFAQ